MMVPEKKYKALRVIATVYKILAFLAGGLCIIFGLVMLVAGIGSGMGSHSRDVFSTGGPFALFGGFLGAVIMLFYGVILFVVLYGAGEFIYVFLDIEENTRMTNYTLSSRGAGPH